MMKCNFLKFINPKINNSLLFIILISLSVTLVSCEKNIVSSSLDNSSIDLSESAVSKHLSKEMSSEAPPSSKTSSEPAITTVPVVKLNYSEVLPPENMKPVMPKNFLVSKNIAKFQDLNSFEFKGIKISAMILWTSPQWGQSFESDGDFYLKNFESKRDTSFIDVGVGFLTGSLENEDYVQMYIAKVDGKSNTGKIFFDTGTPAVLPSLTRQFSIVSPRNPLNQKETDDTSNLTTFDPKEFAIPQKHPYRLRDVCITPLLNMLEAAEEDGNQNITLRDTFRGYSIQAKMFNAGVQKRVSWGMDYNEAYRETDRRTAFPGTSEHHDGYTVDISTVDSKLEQNFGKTKFGKWLSDNSYKYGFIIRYQQKKEPQTTKFYEPWHVRYVGVPAAFVINEFDLALEEFHAWLKEYKYLPFRYENPIDGQEKDLIFFHALSKESIKIPQEFINNNRLLISEKGDGKLILQFLLN